MKTLIIDTIYEKNSILKLEFVKPIEQILNENKFEFKSIHFSEIETIKIEDFNNIILCGTAMQDFNYIQNIQKYNWIKNINKPILGICSGSQIIAKVFSIELIKCVEIGMFEINIVKENKLLNENFNGYCMHNLAFKTNENFEILAKSKKCNQIIKHKNKEIYAVLFHPEVRCEELIINFLKKIIISNYFE